MILDKDTRLELELFAVAMDVKLDRKQKEYGDSWKTCDVDILRKRLRWEIQEFNALVRGSLATHPIIQKRIRTELVDIANVCMMLWYRLMPYNFEVYNPPVESQGGSNREGL